MENTNEVWPAVWELKEQQAKMNGFYEGMRAQREHAAYDKAMYGAQSEEPKPKAGNGTKAMSILGTIGFGLITAAILGGDR